MNTVHLFGNVGADPETRNTQSGDPVTNLSLATSRRVKKGDEWQDATEWHRLVCFGKRAEVLAEYVRKGSKLCVRGRLQTRKWEDREGVTRYTTEVVIEDFDFGGGPRQGEGKSYAEASGGFRDKAPADDEIPF